MPDFRLAAEGDTADGLTIKSTTITIRGVDAVWIKIQAVSNRTITANRGPIVAIVACAAQQPAVQVNKPAPDKHQRRLHNSIRIS